MQWMGKKPVILALRLLVTATLTAWAVTTYNINQVILQGSQIVILLSFNNKLLLIHIKSNVTEVIGMSHDRLAVNPNHAYDKGHTCYFEIVNENFIVWTVPAQ